MASPLQTYKEVAKQFGATGELNAAPIAQLAFAREQADQMQHIVNRLVFDITQSKLHEANAKDENTASAYEGKRRQYEGDLRQTVASLKLTQELVKELEKEVTEA